MRLENLGKDRTKVTRSEIFNLYNFLTSYLFRKQQEHFFFLQNVEASISGSESESFCTKTLTELSTENCSLVSEKESQTHQLSKCRPMVDILSVLRKGPIPHFVHGPTTCMSKSIPFNQKHIFIPPCHPLETSIILKSKCPPS